MIRAAIVFVVLLPALGAVSVANAAAPRLIMVSGSLDHSILISEGEEVFELYSSFYQGQVVDAGALEGRSSFRLGLFWDNRQWEPYVREGRLDELTPEQANQVGRFYPATGDQLALVDIPASGTWPRRASEAALSTLEVHGVPVRLEDSEGSQLPWIGAAVAGAALGLIALLVLALRVRRARSSGPRLD